jgi:hypothetical protein
MSEDVIQLEVVIIDETLAPDQLDTTTTSLISQLRELNVDSVEYRTEGRVIIGAKGEPITMGAILLALGVAYIPPFLALIQNWLGETRKVRIKAPNGAEIEFVPDKDYTEAEMIAFVEKLSKLPGDLSKPKE